MLLTALRQVVSITVYSMGVASLMARQLADKNHATAFITGYLPFLNTFQVRRKKLRTQEINLIACLFSISSTFPGWNSEPWRQIPLVKTMMTLMWQNYSNLILRWLGYARKLFPELIVNFPWILRMPLGCKPYTTAGQLISSSQRRWRVRPTNGRYTKI